MLQWGSRFWLQQIEPSSSAHWWVPCFRLSNWKTQAVSCWEIRPSICRLQLSVPMNVFLKHSCTFGGCWVEHFYFKAFLDGLPLLRNLLSVVSGTFAALVPIIKTVGQMSPLRIDLSELFVPISSTPSWCLATCPRTESFVAFSALWNQLIRTVIYFRIAVYSIAASAGSDGVVLSLFPRWNALFIKDWSSLFVHNRKFWIVQTLFCVILHHWNYWFFSCALIRWTNVHMLNT